MFEITFLHPPESSVSAYETQGRIVAGELDELFLSPIDYWREGDYVASWVAELTRMIDGSRTAVLLTHADDVGRDTTLRGFVCYRFAQEIRIQEALFETANSQGEYDLNRPCTLALEYQCNSDDGQEISEWRVSIEEIERFLLDRVWDSR